MRTWSAGEGRQYASRSPRRARRRGAWQMVLGDVSPTTGFMNDCICWTFTGQFAGTYLDPQQQSIPSPQDCYTGLSSGTFN